MKFSRRLVCMLLMLALLASPALQLLAVPASASAALPGTVYGGDNVLIPADDALSSILIGLGLGPSKSSPSDWMNMIQNKLTSALQEGSLVQGEDGKYYAQAISPETGKYYLSKNLIDVTRAWLFSSGTVSIVSPSAASSDYFDNSSPIFVLDCSFKNPKTGKFTGYRLIYSDSPFSFYVNSSLHSASSYKGYYFRAEELFYNSISLPHGTLFFPDYDPYGSSSFFYYVLDFLPSTSGSSYFSTVFSIFDVVPSKDSLLSDNYSVWSSYEKNVSSGDEKDPIPYWPVYIPADSGTADITQEEVWTGSVSDAWTTSPPVELPDTITPSFLKSLFDSLIASMIGNPREYMEKAQAWLLENKETIVEPVVEAIDPVVQAIDNIGLKIQSLGETILEGLKSLFIPRAEYLTEKLEFLQGQFPFVNAVILSAKELGSALQGFGGEPPIIYAELHNASGSFNWGDRAVALDMRWYSAYKPTVDAIISGFLWAVFIWRVFVKLPGIINGAPGQFIVKSFKNSGGDDV